MKWRGDVGVRMDHIAFLGNSASNPSRCRADKTYHIKGIAAYSAAHFPPEINRPAHAPAPPHDPSYRGLKLHLETRPGLMLSGSLALWYPGLKSLHRPQKYTKALGIDAYLILLCPKSVASPSHQCGKSSLPFPHAAIQRVCDP